jgi:23S rRNA pseudouridine2604 synthase
MNVLRQGLKGKDGAMYHFKRISLKRGLTYSVVLTEGKKHEIREAIGALGGRVRELERIRIAMIMLGSLKVGQYRALEKLERQQLEGLLTKDN